MRRTGWDLALAEGCLEGRRGRHFEKEDPRIETVGVHAAAWLWFSVIVTSFFNADLGMSARCLYKVTIGLELRCRRNLTPIVESQVNVTW
jgi:hypothetical protein